MAGQVRVEIYQHAVELAARLYTVVELAAEERSYLRDALDKKSLDIPVLIARALATSGYERREHFACARRVIIECAAIIDMLRERAAVDVEVLGPARSLASTMLHRIDELTYRFGAA